MVKICRTLLSGMTVLTEKAFEDILEYLEKSVDSLAVEAFGKMEIGGMQKTLDFLQNQFDMRLENLLAAKSSGIHHLESGFKNRAIQKRQDIISRISKRHKT